MDREQVSQAVIIASAGYAGLHIAQRLGSWLDRHHKVNLTTGD